MRWALVQGASRGIGLALVQALLEKKGVPDLASSTGEDLGVIATCRHPSEANELQHMHSRFPNALRILAIDVEHEASIAESARVLREEGVEIDLLINSAGLLHDRGMKPEKSLGEVDPVQLHRAFAVNSVGPLLMAKHFHRLLPRRRRSVFASLSARIGSIGDNRRGGWYAYRASKCAQNMITRSLRVEFARVRPHAICLALHPGTVATELTAPFRRGLKNKGIFAPEAAAENLLRVIEKADQDSSGKFYAWDGSEIEW